MRERKKKSAKPVKDHPIIESQKWLRYWSGNGPLPESGRVEGVRDHPIVEARYQLSRRKSVLDP